MIELHRGDCFDLLPRLRDRSVHAVITDPPYGTMDARWDVPLNLRRWWEAIEPKLSRRAVVIVFAAGRFLFDLHASNPRWFRYDLVWKKDRAVGFLNASWRPLISHEHILVFSRRIQAAAYSPQKTPSGKERLPRHQCPARRRSSLYRGHARGFTWIDDGTRHPTSVLEFASVRSNDRIHPTQKPIDLIRWLVRTYTRAGDLIIDPFVGGGTMPAAAMLEDRRFWGCEKNAAFYHDAVKRIARIDAPIPPRRPQ